MTPLSADCFACGRKLRQAALRKATTADGQIVEVGPNCLKHVKAAGTKGYQPPIGGPLLFEYKAKERSRENPSTKRS
jgi:hypothetical protein